MSPCHNIGSGSEPPGVDSCAALTSPQIGFSAGPHFNSRNDNILYTICFDMYTVQNGTIFKKKNYSCQGT